MKPDQMTVDPVTTETDATGSRAGEGALVFDTTLLGPLVIPDGAGRAAELADLAARATHYAVRAAMAPVAPTQAVR
jgi:hypothetical protein